MKVKFTDGFRESAHRIGIESRSWQKNWWDWVRTFYWNAIPYDYRPGQLWYRFTCWAWKRYRTIHPSTMPGHTWVDRCDLLPHCMFHILVEFVEKEKPDKHFDLTESTHKADWDKLFATYRWWKEEYLPYYVRWQKGNTELEEDLRMETELTKRCHDLVDVMGHLWT